MDELEISGRRHISSARAAKEHKYHADYIGQLVRGGKVSGQKVGRAWYVDADSLSEYLGKEVPARGPMVKKAKVEPAMEEAVIGKIPVLVVDEKREESEVRDISADSHEPTFIMPIRKTSRQHVVAALSEDAHKEIAETEIKTEKEAEEKEEIKIEREEVVVEHREVAEEIAAVSLDAREEPRDEEETFIPVKITKEKTQDVYAEPEDSFYKVSRRGLRYVAKPAVREVAAYTASPIKIKMRRPKERVSANRMALAASVVLTAGILSLGAGALLSYYLHSVTSIQDNSQTSSVLLSN